jgi:hypothetical protein
MIAIRAADDCGSLHLFGRWASRWRIIRTSNAYVFRDPLERPAGVPSSKSENRIRTRNQEILPSLPAPAINPDSPLERALQHLGAGIKDSLLLNDGARPVLAT